MHGRGAGNKRRDTAVSLLIKQQYPALDCPLPVAQAKLPLAWYDIHLLSSLNLIGNQFGLPRQVNRFRQDTG